MSNWFQKNQFQSRLVELLLFTEATVYELSLY